MRSRFGKIVALSLGFLSSQSVGKERHTGIPYQQYNFHRRLPTWIAVLRQDITTTAPVRYQFTLVGPTHVHRKIEPDLTFLPLPFVHQRRKCDHRGGQGR